MLHLTWDTNCIITMEEVDDPSRAADRAALEKLLALHDAGRLEIRVPAAMASETQRDGSYIQNFEELRARFAADGLDRLVSVPQPAPIVFGMAVFDNMAFDDGLLLPRIFAVMFPGAAFEGPRPGENEQRWWGCRVDAAVCWGHIKSGGELLVTADQKGFIRGGRREALLAFGGRAIVTPVDAVEWVNNELGYQGPRSNLALDARPAGFLREGAPRIHHLARLCCGTTSLPGSLAPQARAQAFRTR